MKRQGIDETIEATMHQIKAGVDGARSAGCSIPEREIEVSMKLSTEDGRPVQVTIPLVLTTAE
jgi:hypothetical protein